VKVEVADGAATAELLLVKVRGECEQRNNRFWIWCGREPAPTTRWFWPQIATRYAEFRETRAPTPGGIRGPWRSFQQWRLSIHYLCRLQ